MRNVALVLATLLLTACATDSATMSTSSDGSLKIVDLYPKFKTHMGACTATHGFDPETAVVGENALAPGEKPWRACVYQGIAAYIVTYFAVPRLYKKIVAEDQAMTEQIASGQLTRSARRARLEDLIQQIRTEEINRRDILMMQANELNDFVKRQQEIDEITRMHRQADELSRLLRSINVH